MGYLTGLELSKQYFPETKDDFAYMQPPIMELPTSIYFNKPFPNSVHYVAKFREGFQAVVKSGKYIHILEKYYGKGKIPF